MFFLFRKESENIEKIQHEFKTSLNFPQVRKTSLTLTLFTSTYQTINFFPIGN